MSNHTTANTYPDRLLRIADVVAITTLSKSCILLWVAQDRFPKPADPSSTVKVWRLSQVMAWMDELFSNPSCDPTTEAIQPHGSAKSVNEIHTLPYSESKPLVEQLIQEPAKKCKKVNQDLHKEWSEFIHGAANWTTALTVTVKRFHKNQTVSSEHVRQALRHFLRRLDFSCLGDNKAKKGAFVESVVVIGWGTYKDHPHAHLALVCPSGLTNAKFLDHIERAASGTEWFDRERKICEYTSGGWSTYMVDHDPENLESNLLRINKAVTEV